jgi:hypothetical protein
MCKRRDKTLAKLSEMSCGPPAHSCGPCLGVLCYYMLTIKADGHECITVPLDLWQSPYCLTLRRLGAAKADLLVYKLNKSR